MYNDPYEILGVSRGASDSEVKKAYKKKAMEHHPDRNPGDREGATRRFKEVSSAYEAIRNGGGGMNGSGNPFSSGNPFNSHGNMYTSHTFTQEDADKIFREIFGNNFARHNFDQTFNEAFGQRTSRRGSRSWEEISEEAMRKARAQGGFWGKMAQDPFSSRPHDVDNMGSFTSFTTKQSTFTNERGETVKRTETVSTDPNGRQHKEVHEEVIGSRKLSPEEQKLQDEARAEIKRVMKTVLKQSAKLAASAVVASTGKAIKNGVSGLLRKVTSFGKNLLSKK